MNLIWKWRVFRDTRGQDLVEYALMAGFVATAAGALVPGVTGYLVTIFCDVQGALALAGGGDAGGCFALAPAGRPIS